MNFLKECVKYCKTKFIHFCLLIIIVTLLSLLALFWLFPLPFPKDLDIEVQRNRSAPLCIQHSCMVDWIEKYQSNANVSQIHEKCSDYAQDQYMNKTLEVFQEGKVDWKFMRDYHGFRWYRKCHRKCGIDGPFRYFESYTNYYLALPIAWIQHELCESPYKTKDACRWRGYRYLFYIYFFAISIPLKVILNFINLTTLLKLLGKDAGPALYLHTAEIVTDGILNIIVGLHWGLYVFHSLDSWLKTCGYPQYCSIFNSASVVQNFLSMLNQAYLMGLLADRYYALTQPFNYNAMDDKQKKKRAKSIILKTLLGCCTATLPIFLFYTFYPIFADWMKISNLNIINISVVASYISISLSLLIFQIIYGVLVERKFGKFIKNKMELKQESEVELTKRERDKQFLLGGTIGLNIVTILLKTAFNLVTTGSILLAAGYDKEEPWWLVPFIMADPVLTFINGNGGLVIHILFVKSYRRAFKATWFGRLIFRHQQVHPTQ